MAERTPERGERFVGPVAVTVVEPGRPIGPDDPRWKHLTDEEREEYRRSHGATGEGLGTPPSGTTGA